MAFTSSYIASILFVNALSFYGFPVRIIHSYLFINFLSCVSSNVFVHFPFSETVLNYSFLILLGKLPEAGYPDFHVFFLRYNPLAEPSHFSYLIEIFKQVSIKELSAE